MSSTFAGSTGRLVQLAWPVFLGQLSVVAFGTIDTLMVARYSGTELAALAVGTSAYFTTFIGLMGVVLAIGPIAGQLYGARKLDEAGRQLHQAIWVAGLVALPGMALLLLPEPYMALAQVPPEIEGRARIYLALLALALPASLLFSAWRGFTLAVSRPRVVMVLQLAALALKVPLSAALVWGVPALHVPSLGMVGCAAATLVVMWLQVAAAWWIVRHDRFYDGFGLRTGGLRRPDRASIGALLRLGIPMGGGLLIEVSGFTMMALFIARLGTTPVAGHQIAVNMVSILFMVPLALANAASTLVAQRVGARDLPDARRLGWHALVFGTGVATVLGLVVFALREPIVGLYTGDAAVVAAALPLLAWLAVFHIADAAQTLAAFVLRAWRIATGPMLIYAASLWGVGLGGGYLLAFDVLGSTPGWATGARGYWIASTTGLVLASVGLTLLLAWVMRHKSRQTLAG
ncbi:MAG: MATE family efflux transporter [Rubrivivax sp.]|nr:MATE family efflux transporter [Rubrivivax sp.]